MTKLQFKLKSYPCLFHMSEVKQTKNGHLFNNYHKKEDMIKYLIKNVSSENETGSYGKISGKMTCNDTQIELYDLTDVNKDISSEIKSGESFIIFCKNDGRRINWFIRTNVN